MLIKFRKKDSKNKIKLLSFLRKNQGLAKLKFICETAAEIEELSSGKASYMKPLIEAIFPQAEIHLSNEELFPQTLKSRFNLPSSFEIIAGPCAVEDRKTYLEAASFLSSLGIKFMRASLFKPRRSNYCFQGIGEEGFEIISEAKDLYKIRTVTELLSHCDLNSAKKYCDIIQIGARNMRNYELIKSISLLGKPMIIKRAQGASIKEWLMSAEYAAVTNKNLIFCERGDSGLFNEGGVNFNLAAKAKKEFGITVIADVSHSSLGSDYVEAGVLSALAFGLDGAMVEIHQNPQKARVDGRHAISFKQFEKILEKLNKVKKCLKN